MKMIQLAVLCVFLVACGTTDSYIWVKHEKPASQRDFDLDDMQCTREAATTYPRDDVSYTAGTPRTMSCARFGSGVNCTESGGEKTYSYDANADGRTRFWNTCMSSKGWSKQRNYPNRKSETNTHPTNSIKVEPGGYCQVTSDCTPRSVCRCFSGSSCQDKRCVRQ